MPTENRVTMTKTPEQPQSGPLEASSEVDLRLEDMSHLSAEEARLLRRHFEIFTETTNKLVTAHQHLQLQVRALLEELEQKNRELESVNSELAHRIRETEQVREFLDRVIDSMHTGLVAIDVDGYVTRINEAARVLLGWEDQSPSQFEELVANQSQRILPAVSDWDQAPRSGETRLRKRHGDTLLVRYTAVPIAPSGGEQTVQRGTLFVFEDLSRLRLLEEKVRRASRLTALGELAAGVAHEMRNPLATMRGFLQLLPSEFEDPGFREECSTRLIREIDRLARLTESLLELARPVRPDDYETDLKALVEEVLNEQQEALQVEDIRLEIHLMQIPPLPLDRDRIKQVLLNLIINARQAMAPGGKLEVTLEPRPEAWGAEDQLTLLAVLSVRDNGKGIESHHLDQIFDPFFTTRDEGTGLGLALCYRIIEEHGGVIRVESTPGKGSAFTLYFPIRCEE
ncbi:MAG: PAS domain-containing protein [Candidatus Omnitrophica bacterium COP1]|nr:PAS domain-containing protein [Candidatus Omnitrophica bacterium COP1]